MMIAFSIYSRIPMPAFLWEEKDRKRAMYFFPLVGAVVGVLFYGAFWFLEYKGAGTVFSAAVLTAIPFFVTGGIHMDGFLDTCDARASFGDREKKLEILKDPHTGAFGVILGILYLNSEILCGDLNRNGPIDSLFECLAHGKWHY